MPNATCTPGRRTPRAADRRRRRRRLLRGHDTSVDPERRSRARSSPSNCTPCTTRRSDRGNRDRQVADRRFPGRDQCLPLRPSRRRAFSSISRAWAGARASGTAPRPADSPRCTLVIRSVAHRGRRGSPRTAPATPNTARAAPGSPGHPSAIRCCRHGSVPRPPAPAGSATLKPSSSWNTCAGMRASRSSGTVTSVLLMSPTSAGAGRARVTRWPRARPRRSRSLPDRDTADAAAISCRTQSVKLVARRHPARAGRTARDACAR